MSQGHDQKHRQGWNKQHGKMIPVPKVSVNDPRIHGVFDGTKQHPQHHQPGNSQKIPPHLGLHNTQMNGESPCAEQKKIDPAAQIHPSNVVQNAPAGPAHPHGKPDQHKRCQGKQDALFCCFAHTVPPLCTFVFPYYDTMAPKKWQHGFPALCCAHPSMSWISEKIEKIIAKPSQSAGAKRKGFR